MTLATICRHGRIHTEGAPCPCDQCTEDRYQDNRRRNEKPVRKQWRSTAYQRARQRVLARDNHRCTNCGTRENLSVHHARLGPEHADQWRTLCLTCHGAKDGAAR